MIGTVIVPLDGSDLAAEALPYAKAIADRTTATLHLLEVVPRDAKAPAQNEARDYLRKQAGAIADRVQISVRLGDAAEEIIAGVEEMPEPIIVMTTRGRSGLGRWLFGSVADRVVRGADAPVLLVRSGMARAEDGAIRSILVPVDGSVYAEQALGYAEELAGAFGADLKLVRVVETAQIYALMTPSNAVPVANAEVIEQVVAQRAAEANQYLSGLTERLKGAGLSVQTETLEGTPAEQILAYARQAKTELIVMATHGRSGLNRLVFGSVAERILKSGETPVMMVHPQGELEEK